ncbi:MAG: glycine cleavage system protein GcvH [Acidobacteriota bacterium]
MIPEKLRYTREHEWLQMEEDLATIGITHHAQSAMGDLVFVELPAKGDQVEAGQPLGSVESVKSVSEVFSPVKGEVVEVNTLLEEKPELVNEDPYGKGWLIRVALKGTPSGLMTAAEYRAFLENEPG